MNRDPLPLMNELHDRVQGAKIFTKIDLKWSYNLIRIKEGDEWKTAFRTRYDLYEYLVMPFGLGNVPATFQNMINEVLRDLIDQGVVAYMDDILIYSPTEDEHVHIVTSVLRLLQENGLVVAPEKCEWHTSKVEFLGYIISADGVSMAEDKVQTLLEWAPATNLMAVQSFLGFANFYRRFIEGFSIGVGWGEIWLLELTIPPRSMDPHRSVSPSETPVGPGRYWRLGERPGPIGTAEFPQF